MKSANYCIKDHLQKFLLDKQKFVACKERRQSKRASSEKNLQATYIIFGPFASQALTQRSLTTIKIVYFMLLSRHFLVIFNKKRQYRRCKQGREFYRITLFLAVNESGSQSSQLIQVWHMSRLNPIIQTFSHLISILLNNL